MTETYADKAIILEPSTLKVLSGDGTLEIRTGAIDYYKKSTAVKVAFGMIGSLIEGRGKLMFSIQDSDVFRYDYIPYKKGQIPVITLKNGIAYAVSFAHPAQSCPLLDAHIRSLFSREETRQPEPEPRIQQRTMGSSPRTETINMAEETEKAEEYYKMASQYYAGTGGVRQDYEKALEYYTAAAKLKHSDAMYMLGTMFLEGNGTPVNDNLALVWLNLAAVKDNRYALKQLGYLHRIGRGVPQDYQKAMEYYRKAVDAGNIDCWNNIGFLYMKGCGVSRDYRNSMPGMLRIPGMLNDHIFIKNTISILSLIFSILPVWR